MPQYYPDPEEDEGSSKSAENNAPDETKEDESPSVETALIPKTLLGGKEFEVGDEVVLEIVQEYEDEVEVKYASENPSEKPESKQGLEGARQRMAMGPGMMD